MFFARLRSYGSNQGPRFAVWLRMTTFLARVLNLAPFGCFTVMETWPDFPVLISCAVPVFPTCVPPITLHRAPSLIWFAAFDLMLESIAVFANIQDRSKKGSSVFVDKDVDA